MFKFKQISKEQLKVVITNAAAKTGVKENIIEKDYWVCFVLNYLFSDPKWKDIFIFKGGTSLSKCYHLINRFSEDIDLILDWRELGYQKDEPWMVRSKNKQDIFNKMVNKNTSEFLLNCFIPKMKEDFQVLLGDSFDILIDKEESQTVIFEYPRSFESNYVLHVIRLEIGALAEWNPNKKVRIQPDLQKVYPILFDGEFIEVNAILPERTFWEKATILHHEANRPKGSVMPTRYSRHYYDLYAISKGLYCDNNFKDLEILKNVVAFKQKFYPRNWAKYEEAVSTTIRLIPEMYRIEEIKADYQQMSEMFIGEYPDFDELIKVIAEIEEEIHKL